MIGYSASNASMKPAIRYAGRLFGDALNSLPQTEVDLIQGTGIKSATAVARLALVGATIAR